MQHMQILLIPMTMTTIARYTSSISLPYLQDDSSNSQDYYCTCRIWFDKFSAHCHGDDVVAGTFVGCVA